MLRCLGTYVYPYLPILTFAPYLHRYLYLCLCVQLLSHVWLFVTLWTVARWAPLSMGFSRQEYWNGLPFPPPGDRPDPGIELASPASVPSIGRWILYHWAIWEALPGPILVPKPIPITCTYHLLVFGHENYQYIFTYKNGRVYLNIADLYCNHRFCLTWDMQQLYKSESPCINLRIPLSLHIMFSLENLWQVIYIKLKQNFLCVLLPENWKICWHP